MKVTTSILFLSGVNMKLYHYSTSPYNTLRSLYSRGLQRDGFESEDNDPWGYNKNISFFFEEIPLDLPVILEHKHKFWKSGVKLYQHVIFLDDLPKDIHYRIVETYERTELVYIKQDWSKVNKNHELKEKYIEEILDMQDEMLFTGVSMKELKIGLSRTRYNIRRDYKDMVRLDKAFPKDGLMDLYAGTVPHLMAYVGSHDLKVRERKMITLL